jgi:nucleoside-diphosphate-sugar epimerase
VLALHDLPPVRRRISTNTALMLATMAETVWRTCRLTSDPPLTRFLAEEMATDHYFDISAARRDIGYTPSCTVWEETERSFRSR